MADVTRFLLSLWSAKATLATAPLLSAGPNVSRTMLPLRLRREAFATPVTATMGVMHVGAGGSMV